MSKRIPGADGPEVPDNIPPSWFGLGGRHEATADHRELGRVMHELFTGLVAGGFTEGQALQMLGAMLATSAGNGGGSDG